MAIGSFRQLPVQRRGAVMVETAVCLPVLVLLILGMLEACRMIYLQQSLKIAAFEGARTSLIPGTVSGDVTAVSQQVLDDRSVQGATITVDPINYETAPVGTFISVEITAPCDQNHFLSTVFFQNRTMTGEVQLMKEF